MIVESLQLLLGFEFDEKELKKFDESVKEINKSLIALGATVVASATAITAMTLSSSRGAVDMLKLSSATGTAVENLEALEYVSAQNSIASSTLSGALESVRNNIAGISKGGGSALEAFSMLGISAYGADGKLRDSYETMKEATEKLSKMTDATRQAEYAQQIFGGSASEMMFMIRKGSQAFKDGELAMKQYGSAVPASELENIAKFSQSWDMLTNSFSQFTQLVWGKLAPSMNTLIEGLLKWWEINKAIVTENAVRYYKAFANTIGIMVKWFFELLKIASKVIDAFGGLERVLKLSLYAFTAILSLKFLSFLGSLVMMAKTVGTAFMAMNIKMMLIPIAIGALIAVASLLVEDFIGMLRGKNSVIGDIIGEEWVEKLRSGYAKLTKWTKDNPVGVFGFTPTLFPTLVATAMFKAKEAIKEFIDWSKIEFTKLSDYLSKPFNDIKDFFTVDDKTIKGLGEYIKNPFGGFLTGEDKASSSIGHTNQSSTSSVTQNNNPVININSTGQMMPERMLSNMQFDYNQTFNGYSPTVQ